MRNANVNFAKTIAAIYMKDSVQRCQESGKTQPTFVSVGLSERPPRKHRSIVVREVFPMGGHSTAFGSSCAYALQRRIFGVVVLGSIRLCDI